MSTTLTASFLLAVVLYLVTNEEATARRILPGSSTYLKDLQRMHLHHPLSEHHPRRLMVHGDLSHLRNSENFPALGNSAAVLSRLRRVPSNNFKEEKTRSFRHHQSKNAINAQRDKRNNAYRMCHFKLCNLGKRG